jgi:hypothetical protein
MVHQFFFEKRCLKNSTTFRFFELEDARDAWYLCKKRSKDEVATPTLSQLIELKKGGRVG